MSIQEDSSETNNNNHEPMSVDEKVEDGSQVTTQTKPSKKYRHEHITFILWIHDSGESLRKLCFKEWFLTALKHANDYDMGQVRRPSMRKACNDAIEAVYTDETKCPIILSRLTYDIFLSYINYRKQKNPDLAKYSIDHIYGAVRHLFRISAQPMDESLKDNIWKTRGRKKSLSVSGSEVVEKEKDDGKQPMGFGAYSKMCDIFYSGDNDEFLFAHAYLTLEWNLMAKSIDIKLLCIAKIQVQDDCLTVSFGNRGAVQNGTNTRNYALHLYSNPSMPHLCPVLSLGKYLLSYPELFHSGGILFPGVKQDERFLAICKKTMQDNKEAFEKLGASIEDYGKHAWRKGSIHMMSTGGNICPNMSSICLRAGWDMGPIKNQYIKYDKDGDQFLGRCVTGVSYNTKEFASSPVYFEMENAPESVLGLIAKAIGSFVTSAGPLSNNSYSLLNCFFAAICFHHSDLEKRTSQRNRLRTSTLFLAAMQEIRGYAVVSFPWKKTKHTPAFTGIPPHVLLFSEARLLKHTLIHQQGTMLESMKEELDKHPAGNTLQAYGILYKATEAHSKMIQLIDNFDKIPCVEKDRVNDSTNFENYMPIKIENTNDVKPVTEIQPRTNTSESPVTKWKSPHNASIRLPNTFEFPSMTLSGLIQMWYCGDIKNNIPPYKMIRPIELTMCKNGKNTLSHMKALMKHVERAVAIIDQPFLLREIWHVDDTIALYNAIKHLFRFDCIHESKKRRYDTLSWKTYYNKISARKGKLMGEI